MDNWCILAVALLNPLIKELSNRIHNNWNYLFYLLLIYIFYLAIVPINNQISGLPQMIYEQLILYTIFYGLLSTF